MITEYVEYEFIGFNPEYNIKNMIAVLAEKTYMNAPSNSAIKLVLRKSQDLVMASCRIGSQVGTFVSKAAGKNPIQAIQDLEKQIKIQLDSWKMNRYQQAL
jgi:trehalose-6-phosphate synthase